MAARIGAGWAWAAVLGAASLAWAEPPADRVEAIQSRAWAKKGGVTIAPLLDGAFNDPFVWRGGLGLRLTAWPRSLVGFSLTAEYGAQTPSGAAHVAQRELRARLRPAATAWSAVASFEACAMDGKFAMGGGIVPFELLVRAGAGASGVQDLAGASPSVTFAAGVGVRWFLTSASGLETTLGWRSASVGRTVAGRDVAARDTIVSFEVAVPVLVGGGR